MSRQKNHQKPIVCRRVCETYFIDLGKEIDHLFEMSFLFFLQETLKKLSGEPKKRSLMSIFLSDKNFGKITA